MALHLLKLCVGVDTVQELEDWIKVRLKEKRKKGEKPEHIHTTRMVPKRADEIVDGGSLFWVIKGQILCREKLLAIRPFNETLHHFPRRFSRGIIASTGFSHSLDPSGSSTF